MKIINKINILSILFNISLSALDYKKENLGEELNSLVFIVGKSAITRWELEKIKPYTDYLSKMSKQKISPEDFLIEKTIVEQVANEESIIVSEEKLKNEIEKRRSSMGIVSMDEFKKRVQLETQIDFNLWKDVLRYQILKQLLIQIKIPVSQPTQKEIENFYRKNKKELGMEVMFREIIFPITRTIAEEKNIYEVVKKTYQELKNNPESFSQVARNLNENISHYKRGGGIRLWIPIIDLAKEDQIIAGAVFQLPVGSLSPIFKNQKGQYVILKIEGKRDTPLEKVEELIRIKLYYDRIEDSFQDWLKHKKSTFIIKKIE